MYCSKCGMQNFDEATQCSNCGSALVQPSQQAVAQGVPVTAIEPETCGLAIAALVMGIISIFCSFLLGIPAIICGFIALSRIKSSGGRLKGRGMAIAGIIVPSVLIVISVFAMLLAILMPALGKVKQIAQREVCATNLKGISTAMIVYMDDYDEEYPTPDQWCDLLIQGADVSPKSFQCPLDPEGSFSYAMNENLYKIAPGKLATAQMVVLFEADLGRNGVGGPEDLILRHDQNQRLGCNIAFEDGHVEFVTEDHIADLQWTLE